MNAKLRLNLDELSVDSFDTQATEKEKGTVFGEQQCTCVTLCTCPGCPTCDASCNGTCATCGQNTCAASCNGTCAGATCAYSCNYTDCDCEPPTCLQTNCGPGFCCA